MKIAHVCQFLGVGGLEKVLFGLALAQKANGHEVKILVYDHQRQWVEKFRKAGIQVDDGYLKKPGYDLGLSMWLSKKCAGMDIVHTHDLNPMLYIGPVRLLQKLSALFTRKRCFGLVHTTHGMEHLKEHPKHELFERALCIFAQRLVAVSPAFMDYYKAARRANPEKVRLVENGTFVERQLPRLPCPKTKAEICNRFGLDPAKKLGVYVGRVSPMKAQLELVRAYREFDHNLLIVGPPSDESYYQRCERAKWKNVVMTGPQDDIRSLLRGCDYFISNSKHEGMPIAALEAGALGLPCLLSKIPGHCQFNKEKELVFLFNKTGRLAKYLSELDSVSEKRRSDFHDFILRFRSLDAMTEKYEAIYKELTC